MACANLPVGMPIRMDKSGKALFFEDLRAFRKRFGVFVSARTPMTLRKRFFGFLRKMPGYAARSAATLLTRRLYIFFHSLTCMSHFFPVECKHGGICHQFHDIFWSSDN